MKKIKCPKCGQLLVTTDIWCYLASYPEKIIIAIQCNECDWTAAQTIRFSDFKGKTIRDLEKLEDEISKNIGVDKS